ncbi:uncharacterized protein LOC105180776 [Harpegnathos saltator]|uniref:uncharacterized protein LOC105180776 n=1 Tax=Harpegnathos saltator TaxID=610380 RepID=UPI000DBEDEA4|nr:uncharacterized protein LOC105180776 [Harpegnathos saltator]
MSGPRPRQHLVLQRIHMNHLVPRVKLRKADRILEARVIRDYKTIPYMAATALASMPPLELQALMHRRIWKRMLAHAKYGRRVVEAVQPCLHEWVGRDFGTLTYRLTQVFIGHGCFVQDCPAWVEEREVVVRELGRDFSLPTVVRSMLESERNWGIFASFCEAVMLQKEAAEETRRQAEGRVRGQEEKTPQGVGRQ